VQNSENDDFQTAYGALVDLHDRIVHECKINQLAIGYMTKDGRFTDRIGIAAFVTNKLNEQQLTIQRISPLKKIVKSVPTDIIAIPQGFRAEVSNWGRHRPFKGGDAGAHYATAASGTFGIINESVGHFEILTNNHVGANCDLEGYDYARAGDPWLQPGAHGGGDASDMVATLHRWNKIVPVPFVEGVELPHRLNLYDVAIGRVNENMTDKVTPGEIRNLGPIEGWEPVQLGDEVTKMGARTGVTNGVVRYVFPLGEVTYVGGYQSHIAAYAMQVEIVNEYSELPFSLPGDSGSVIVTKNVDKETGKRKAKALLFAGGEKEDGTKITTASPIENVIRNFNFKI